MPFISKDAVHSRLREQATNSSHFVWLLADLKYFESSVGWVFAFLQRGTTTLIALEPLIPDVPEKFTATHHEQFQKSWAEFCAATPVRTAAFISVYRPFLDVLKSEKFRTLKIGQEPWVNLDDCIPTGNSGKGVRAARNQALRAGLTVQEWSAQEIESDPRKRQTLTEILAKWKSRRLFDMSGFLNTVDPLAQCSDRRYFVAESANGIEAFLVATPIAGIKSHFLEDLIIQDSAPNGCGELLTLEAMVALKNSGSQKASLGVISLNSLGTDAVDTLPQRLQRGLKILSRIMRLFYNTNGMEIYRRRFKPHSWTGIYLAVNSEKTRDWLKVVLAILLAFRPRLRPTFRWLRTTLTRPLRRYPITATVATISTLCFALINQFGVLPEWALSRFGFFGNAPPIEWPLRSVMSDFLFFNPEHFLTWGGAFILILAWAERKHTFWFLVWFFSISCVFDDVINYWFIIKPFHYFQPKIFQKLVVFKDVGSSLLLTAFLGLQIRQFKAFREPLFAVFSLALILLFLFPASHLDKFVLNLNHFLFFTTGYLVGTLRHEWERAQSRKASKRKPPVANSVLPSHRKATAIAETPEKQSAG